MRSKKVLINIITSLIGQIITVLIGLIIPKLIISKFGSQVNGLMTSITQFLGYIVLLEAGVGGVVRAALYKPLAEKNYIAISRIIKATEKFFRIIAYIFVVYLIILALVFPCVVGDSFTKLYTGSLVVIIGISTFCQYYFGISYQILLQADQKNYVTSFIQIVTTIINAILMVILIRLGASIQIIKSASVFIYVLRPLLINIYVKKRYRINLKCEPDNDAISQRWDGLGHHIAFLLHNNTDVAILTFVGEIKLISVYSVYYMITSSIRIITTTFSSSIEAAFGNMIVKNEKEAIDRNFRVVELISYSTTTVLFTTTAILIIPFVSIYTRGISDINYIRPVFANALILAEAIYCIRMPYSSVVLAAGHYKQTKKGAYIEAVINIIISIFLVRYLGILGVALGTLSAMLFRTIEYAYYLSSNILQRPLGIFINKLTIYFLGSILTIFISKLIPFNGHTYIEWGIYAILITITSSIVVISIILIFYRDDFKLVITIIKNIINKKIIKESV